jgi:hypothetical protein
MSMSRLNIERLVWCLLVFLACTAGVFWSSHKAGAHGAATAQDHMHKGPSQADIQRVMALNQGKPQLPSCRQGAFVDASNMINTVVQISSAIPPNTSALVRADLDSLLYTALKQAKSEVHCVAGGLSYGYDKSFALSIERGIKLAQARNLSPDIVLLGQSVIDALTLNRPTAAAPPHKN